MSDGQVKREVLIELKLVASGTSKTVAAAMKSEIDKVQSSRVTSEESTSKRIEALENQLSSTKSKLRSQEQRDAEKAAKERQRLEEKAAKEQERLAKTAQKEAERAARDQETRDRKVFQNRAKLLASMAKQEDQSRRQADAAERQRAASLSQLSSIEESLGKKRTKAMQAGVAGALALTEGLVTLGLVGEESLEKFVRSFVKVKASFQVVRSGIEVWDKLREVIGTTTKIMEAQAKVQAIASVAGAAGGGGVARAGAGAASGALNVAGATGGAVTGGAAVKAAIGSMGAIAKSASVLAAKFAIVLAAGAALGEGLSATANYLMGGEFKGTLSEWLGWMKDSNKAKEQESRLQKQEEARQQRLARAAERDQQISRKSSMEAAARGEQSGIANRQAALNIDDPAALAENSRLRALSELEKAEAEVAAERERRQERQRRGEVASMADRMQAEERMKAATSAVADAEEQKLSVIKRQVEERKRLVEQADNELRRAQDLRKQEEARAESALAKFGKLSRAEQARASKIGEKVQSGGQVNRQEAEFLERTGLGQKITQDFYANQGRAGGGEAALGALGEMDQLRQARAEEVRQQELLSESKARVMEAEKQQAEQAKRAADALSKLASVADQLSATQGESEGVTVDSQRAVTEVESDMGASVTAIRNAMRNMRQQLQSEAERTAAARGVV